MSGAREAELETEITTREGKHSGKIIWTVPPRCRAIDSEVVVVVVVVVSVEAPKSSTGYVYVSRHTSLHKRCLFTHIPLSYPFMPILRLGFLAKDAIDRAV